MHISRLFGPGSLTVGVLLGLGQVSCARRPRPASPQAAGAGSTSAAVVAPAVSSPTASDSPTPELALDESGVKLDGVFMAGVIDQRPPPLACATFTRP